MRKYVTFIAIGLSILTASSAFADQFVREYVRSDGTYVSPYIRGGR